MLKQWSRSLFLMFIILLTQFNSFYQTLITLSTVVLSFMGVLLGLILTGQKFSIIMTGTGVVALAGIVVNNAIVLIDTYNRFRKDGVMPVEAALKSSAQRIRPVLLTTITTIAGLTPMASQFSLDFINRIVNIGHILVSNLDSISNCNYFWSSIFDYFNAHNYSNNALNS